MHIALAPDQEEEPTQGDVEPIYTQPSVRVLQTWTPAQVRSAISNADSGRMSLAAELCDNLIADESIGGALETRTGGLQGLALGFQDGRGDEAGDSPLAPQLEEDWWHMFPEEETKQVTAWGLILGVGFGEQVWGEFNGRFVPRLKFWHPKLFNYDQTINRWKVRVAHADGQSSDEITIEPHDPKWIVYTPYGSHRPWARGLWRGLSRWWLIKNYAIGDMGAHGEKAALLVITATGDRSPTKDQRSDMSSELQDVGKDGVAALPTNFDIKLVEAKASIEDLYIAQIRAANSAFVLAINGQNLTTEVKGGSLAAAAVHERVEARRIRSDGETLSTAIRGQSLVYWTEWNFGASATAPWPKWETDPPEDQKAKAEVFNATAEALVKIKAAGFEVRDVDEMTEDFGIPELDEKEVDEPEPTPPGDDDGDGDGAPPGDGDDAGDDGDAGASAASGTPQAHLASGLPIAQAQGFVDGQIYADTLTDWAVRIQAKEIRGPDGFVQAVIAAMNISDDYGAIRAAVLAAYEDEATPEEIAEVLEKVFTMARRAGQVAVDQDA